MVSDSNDLNAGGVHGTIAQWSQYRWCVVAVVSVAGMGGGGSYYNRHMHMQ